MEAPGTGDGSGTGNREWEHRETGIGTLGTGNGSGTGNRGRRGIGGSGAAEAPGQHRGCGNREEPGTEGAGVAGDGGTGRDRDTGTGTRGACGGPGNCGKIESGGPAPPRAPPPSPEEAPSTASTTPDSTEVWALLYWRVPERSALALLLALVALGSLSRFSAVSVAAYGALAVLAVTVPLRLRQAALRALGTAAPQPPARVPESLKFAFLFYLLTYVGAVCNGLTLLAAGVVCAFTFPVLYRRHQAQIEQHLSLVRSHLSHLRARVLAKLPSAKVKPQ
ncbi:hypothetical protein DUI87_33467 [Hirundo rustica rustica]|uniref:Reticulon n=1 Tax=Hirundo rustica rustica TaxID=333673 RepID=A0A3M0IME5_HIRRU|nr:hypothetical protein DUI87_33467 [Hirundo rustica rustica]